MCVIVYKPKGISFPKEESLKNCWDRNPDGAGYMFPKDDKVIIRKGFMTYESFKNSLDYDICNNGTDIPFVLHFRITTQGGVKPHLTHPYPLSKNMQDLKELEFDSDIGVAHNGIISLTTSYNKDIDYNDTMSFITEYLSLIIKDREYYKDEDTLNLIEKLCKSKLAIMDGSGTVNLIGNFITHTDGCLYSNDSYESYKCYYGDKCYDYYDYYDYGDYGKVYSSKTKKDKDFYEDFKSKKSGLYYFKEGEYCPFLIEGNKSYCNKCAFGKKCCLKKSQVVKG